MFVEYEIRGTETKKKRQSPLANLPLYAMYMPREAAPAPPLPPTVSTNRIVLNIDAEVFTDSFFTPSTNKYLLLIVICDKKR